MAIPIQRARTQSGTQKSGIARIISGIVPDARTQIGTHFSLGNIRHMRFDVCKAPCTRIESSHERVGLGCIATVARLQSRSESAGERLAVA